MPVFILLLLVATLAVGCSGPTMYHDPETDKHAIEMIWWGVYGAGQDQKPPTVVWRDDVYCLPNDSPDDTTCRDGVYYPGHGEVTVIWEGSYHKSALAHELYHAYLWANGMDDPTHTREGWKTLVPHAQAMLAKEGM